jgi:hypothetical protein
MQTAALENGAHSMTIKDFTEYEKRLAADHERLWRGYLTEVVAVHLCKRRKCRRDGACTGPMRIAPSQASRVRAQREIGLSGKACASLPLCVANIPGEEFGVVEKYMDEFHRLLRENPGYRLPRLDRCREQTPQLFPDP